MAKKKIETPEVEQTIIEKTTEQTFDKMNEIVDETFKVEQDVEPVVEETETPVVEETETPVVEETETPVVEETETPVVEETETPVVEETETPVVEETETPEDDEKNQTISESPSDTLNDVEISELLKTENYFSYLSCGRHLKGKFTEENLKDFYLEYKASDSLVSENHYKLMKLLTNKFEK